MIIHGAKPTRDFTVIANAVLRDDHLSYRARGVLVYLLSQPPDWEVAAARLQSVATEGRDAIRAALRELTNAGYIRVDREQNARGHYSTHYIVSPVPWSFPSPVGRPVDNSA